MEQNTNMGNEETSLIDIPEELMSKIRGIAKLEHTSCEEVLHRLVKNAVDQLKSESGGGT